MKPVLAIAGLTGVFLLALSSTQWEDIVLGAALATVMVTVYNPPRKESRSSIRLVVLHTPRYVWAILVDIVKGTWIVALYVVGLRKLDHPGIIKIPYEDHSPTQLAIAMLAISLSPGSFVVDVNQEERYILGHFIDISNPDSLRQEIHDRYLRVPGM